jgi:hypothetical protein
MSVQNHTTGRRNGSQQERWVSGPEWICERGADRRNDFLQIFGCVDAQFGEQDIYLF